MTDEDSSQNEDTQGMFAVRLAFDGGVSAVLTGEHYSPEEVGAARAIVAEESAKAMAKGSSPVFLVRDSVVKTALGARKHALRSGVSECASGTCGEPCGDCDACRKAESDAFTSVVLGAMELPEGSLAEMLRAAVSSVLGMTWADSPWSTALTDEEVEQVFDELNIKKGTEDESH